MILGTDRNDRTSGKMGVASRLRSIREEIYGPDGVEVLAGKLELPPRTWLNYELGVMIPGETLLRYLELTGIEPGWLLGGAGPRFRPDRSAFSGGPDAG